MTDEILESRKYMAEAATRLLRAHGGVWGEHPTHPTQDWRYAVSNEDTRLGYWEWVASEIETDRGEI